MGLNDPQWGRKRVTPARLILMSCGATLTRNSIASLNARVAEGEVKGRTAVKSLPVANHFTFEAALVLLLECSC